MLHHARPQFEHGGYLSDAGNINVSHSGDCNGSDIVEFEKL
jgi:hypothetical protein